jgi:hypothetical protein
MNSWIVEAQKELTTLAAQAKSDPKRFMHRDGVPKKGPPDGAGALRAAEIAGVLEDLARKARGLVRS